MHKEAANTFRTKGHFPLQKTKGVLLWWYKVAKRLLDDVTEVSVMVSGD